MYSCSNAPISRDCIDVIYALRCCAAYGLQTAFLVHKAPEPS